VEKKEIPRPRKVGKNLEGGRSLYLQTQVVIGGIRRGTARNEKGGKMQRSPRIGKMRSLRGKNGLTPSAGKKGKRAARPRKEGPKDVIGTKSERRFAGGRRPGIPARYSKREKGKSAEKKKLNRS